MFGSFSSQKTLKFHEITHFRREILSLATHLGAISFCMDNCNTHKVNIKRERVSQACNRNINTPGQLLSSSSSSSGTLCLGNGYFRYLLNLNWFNKKKKWKKDKNTGYTYLFSYYLFVLLFLLTLAQTRMMCLCGF